MTIVVPTSGLIGNGWHNPPAVNQSRQVCRLQPRTVRELPDQRSIYALRVTLLSYDGEVEGLTRSLAAIEWMESARIVDAEGKRSVYPPASASAQRILSCYVQAFSRSVPGCGIDPHRIFHVSLTNRTGHPDDSVAWIWQHPFIALR